MSSNLGVRIKFLRERSNLTQLELAKFLNVSNSTLSQYENGQRVPSDEIKIKIAEFFNVTIDYLLGQESKKNKGSSEEPPLSEAQQNLISAVSDLSEEDIKKAIDYVELLKLRRNS